MPEQPKSPISRLLHMRIVRFGFVSAIATIADYGVRLPAKNLLPNLPIYIVIAITLGYLTGTIVHFYLTRWFVFKPTKFHIGMEFFLVLLVAVIAWALTQGIVLTLYWRGKMDFLPANIIATLVVFCWNYLGRRYLIYREHPESAAIAEVEATSISP